MKKKILAAMIMAVMTITASAQYASDTYGKVKRPKASTGWLKTGYRGFADLYFGGTTDDAEFAFSATTAHGYQANEWIFVGAGIGYDTYKYWDWDRYSGSYTEDCDMMTIFASLKLTVPTNSRFYPYIDANPGFAFGHRRGFYINSSIGVRYALNDNLGLNIGVYGKYVDTNGTESSTGVFGGRIGLDF